jgi:signal transduction histidine kinase
MNRMWVLLSIFYTTIIVVIAAVLLTAFTPAFADWRVAELATLSALDSRDAIGLLQAGGIDSLRRSLGASALGPPFIILVLVISSGILASVGVSWLVTRPLRRLDSAMRQLGAGAPSARVAVHGPREVEGLAISFNAMVDELAATERRRQNLLADVSHELRTPLTVLQGNLRGMLDDVYTVDKAHIAKLYDHTLQLTHLVDDLRDLAQAEAHRLPLHRADVDMAALAGQACLLFAPLAEDAGLRLHFQVTPPIPILHGDQQRLTQVLQNLIGNSLKYARSEITLSLSATTSVITLQITDDGPGIARSDLPHVFDRFYRADNSAQGSGLGLAIAASIVQAHGGAITADSVLGRGTTITVTLPVEPTALPVA